jgi:ankyrin repeat protein
MTYSPLLAQLHLSGIAEVSTKADALDRVRSLKVNVLDQYDQNLARINANPAFANLAFRTFTWLLAAHRPLSTNELCEALGIGLHDESFRPDRAPSLLSILESCLGLVKVNKPLNTVEFCHFSVKEHLIRRNHAEEIAVVDVPLSCLRYLRFADFSSLCSDGQSLQQRQDRYPLASYLSEHWASHVRGEPENELGAQVGAFLGSINVISSLQLLPDALRNARLIGTVADMHVDSPPSKQMALYLCTYFSLATAIDTFFDKEVSVDFCVPWGQRYSPAHVAVCYGDVDFLQKILTHANGKDVQDRWGLTPLHLAVRLQSTEEVTLVRTLLSNAADLEPVDQDDDTALHLAVSYATTDSIELLLRAGANVNVQNKRGKTPLHRAIERDSLLVAEMLLNYHANATVLDTDGKSPLGLALERAQLAFINVLTAARDKEGHNYDFESVEKAAAEGFMTLKGDEVQAEKEKQERLEREREECERRRRTQYCGATITELSWAAEKEGFDELQRLIRGGADVNKQDPVTGKTALHHAIENRRPRSVFWLADAGADVCIQDANGKTPLDFIQGNPHIEWQLFHGGAIATRPSDPVIASVIAESRLHRGRHYAKPVSSYGYDEVRYCRREESWAEPKCASSDP